MPALKGQVTVKPGWEHRAFLGAGPFTEEEFATALAVATADNQWGDDEAEQRAAQAYEGEARAEARAARAAKSEAKDEQADTAREEVPNA